MKNIDNYSLQTLRVWGLLTNSTGLDLLKDTINDETKDLLGVFGKEDKFTLVLTAISTFEDFFDAITSITSDEGIRGYNDYIKRLINTANIESDMAGLGLNFLILGQNGNYNFPMMIRQNIESLVAAVPELEVYPDSPKIN